MKNVRYNPPGAERRGGWANYHQMSNISHTFVGNKIVDHSDVVGASPVGAAPTTSSFSTWLQWFGQRQPQDETTNILSFGAPYIRDLTVLSLNLWHTCWCPGSLCHLIIIITIILIRVSHISLLTVPNNPGQVNLGKWIREKFLFLNHIHGPWVSARKTQLHC